MKKRIAILIALLGLMLPLAAAHAGKDDVPGDVRAFYSRAHQCYYYSGEINSNQGQQDKLLGKKIAALNCGRVECDYVAMMEKYKNKPAVVQYLKDRSSNISAKPYESLTAQCTGK